MAQAARGRFGRRDLITAVAVAALVATFAKAHPTMAQRQDPTMTTLSVPTPSGDLSVLKAGAGPALVLVHGIGGRKEDWAAVVAALAGRRTVYAVDMIGFGTSAKSAAEITVATQVAALSALLAAEGHASADLIGNSVGGWVAASFAAAHPARVGRLVLVDPAGFRAMFDGPSPVNFYPDGVEGMEALLRVVRHDPSAHTRPFAERALADLRASGAASAAERVFKGLFASPRLEDVMPGITAPTQVLWGGEDRLFPPALAPYVAGLVPGATVATIPDAGHFPHLDNPAAFLAALPEDLR